MLIVETEDMVVDRLSGPADRLSQHESSYTMHEIAIKKCISCCEAEDQEILRLREGSSRH